YHGGGHAADRAGAGDEDIFAEDIELKRGVDGVAEGIENGLDIAASAAGVLTGGMGCPAGEDTGGTMHPHVRHRHRNIFRKRPRPVDADALGILTKMPPPGQAIAAVAADNVTFAADDLAGPEIFDVGADLDN